MLVTWFLLQYSNYRSNFSVLQSLLVNTLTHGMQLYIKMETFHWALVIHILCFHLYLTRLLNFSHKVNVIRSVYSVIKLCQKGNQNEKYSSTEKWKIQLLSYTHCRKWSIHHFTSFSKTHTWGQACQCPFLYYITCSSQKNVYCTLWRSIVMYWFQRWPQVIHCLFNLWPIHPWRFTWRKEQYHLQSMHHIRFYSPSETKSRRKWIQWYSCPQEFLNSFSDTWKLHICLLGSSTVIVEFVKMYHNQILRSCHVVLIGQIFTMKYNKISFRIV